MRYIGPKVRRSRQVGVPLTAKAFRVMQRKDNLPGVKSFRRKKISDYGVKLLEKQKIRFFYNVTNKYLRKTWKQASSKKGNTGEVFMEMLNMRLDNIIRAMGLIGSIYHAQQLVSHGKVLVNGKKVTISSYRCDVGDEISIVPSMRSNGHLNVYKDMVECPSFLHASEEGFCVKVLSKEYKESPLEVDLQLIAEFFSR